MTRPAIPKSGPGPLLAGDFPREVWEIVEPLALAHPHLVANLLTNRTNLTDAARIALYPKNPKPSQGTALSVIDSGPGHDAIVHILGCERRVRVLRHLAKRVRLDPSEQALFVSRPLHRDVAYNLMRAPWATDATLETLVTADARRIAGGEDHPELWKGFDAMSWLSVAGPDNVSDQRMRRLLSTIHEWDGRADVGFLERLLCNRPHLAPDLVHIDQRGHILSVLANTPLPGDLELQDELCTVLLAQVDAQRHRDPDALAGSETRSALRQLIRNPFVTDATLRRIEADPAVRQPVGSYGRLALDATLSRRRGYAQDHWIDAPLDAVTDPRDLDWLVSWSASVDGSVLSVYCVWQNPNLTERQAVALLGTFGNWYRIPIQLGRERGDALHALNRSRFPGLAKAPWNLTPVPYVPTVRADFSPNAQMADSGGVDPQQAVDWVVGQLGCSPAAWECFSTLYPAIDGTFDEYVTACRSVLV